MLDQVYNDRILELAAHIPRLGRLDHPDASATLRSRLCGSTVTVDVKMTDGKVSDFAHDVKACALGQASSSIMARHVIGANLAELQAVRDTVRRMLKEDGAPPPIAFRRMDATLAAAPTPIAPGEQTLRVSVHVSYEIKPKP